MGQSSANLTKVLTAAASVAWWIVQYRPDLLGRRELSIVVAGAGAPECHDAGKWLTFIPWMLGSPSLVVNLTLVGDQLTEVGREHSTGKSRSDLEREWATPLKPCVARVAPPTIVNGTLATWAAQSPDAPDLVVLFSPGFESHAAEWLKEDELLPLLRRNIPVAAFSYSKMDCFSDWYVLRAYGLRMRNPHYTVNPWRSVHEASRFIGGFAGCAWQLEPVVVPEVVAPDEDVLAEMRSASNYSRESFETHADLAIEMLGSRQAVRVREGGPSDALLVLPDNCAVLESDGRAGDFDEEGFTPYEPAIRVPPEALKAWPCEDSFERQMWAFRTHRDYVAPHLRGVMGDLFNDLIAGSEGQGMAELQKALALTEQKFGHRERDSQAATPGSGSFFAALDAQDFAKADDLATTSPELLSAVDGKGCCAVLRAYQAGERELFANWVKAGANLQLQDEEGFSIVHEVLNKRDTEALRVLLPLNPNLSQKTNFGFTPASMCLTTHNMEALSLLVNAGADLETPTLLGISVAACFEAAQYQVPMPIREQIRARLKR